MTKSLNARLYLLNGHSRTCSSQARKRVLHFQLLF